MTYALGIDLGTTYTAAAVARGGRAEVAALGYRATSVPSVVLLTPDGRFLVGDAAERRATHEPDRVAREFKRRVGDPTPLLLGGAPIPVDRCLAEVLRWVVGTVSEAEGEPPGIVTVTHPANWGEFKRDVLRQALRQVDAPNPGLLPEPVAAAAWYAQAERLEPGRTVAVYDLGGGTFDTTVLRRRADGQFESLGRPEGIERLGGIDIDEAVLGHVLRTVHGSGVTLETDTDDPGLRTATTQLRRACVDAKEALSSETSVTIPVWLPGTYQEILMNRSELEELVEPLLRPTIEALERVVGSAGLQPGDLDAVLLVGGSSRIPLIAQQVSAGLGRPIAVDAHPKHPVALGAALDAEAHLATLPAEGSAPPAPRPVTIGPGGPALPAWPSPGPTSTPTPVPAASPSPTSTTTVPTPVPTSTPVPAPPRAPGPAPFPTSPPFPPPRVSRDDDASGRRMLVLAWVVSPLIVIAVMVVGFRLSRAGQPSGDGGTSTGDGTGKTEVIDQASEGPGESDTTDTTAPAAPVNLMTTDPAPAITAFAGIYDTPPRVQQINLYSDYALIDVQVPTNPTYVDEYTWSDGELSGPEPQQLMDMEVDELEAKLFDLAEVDPAVVPAAAQQTLQSCPGDGIELSHVIIERELTFDDQQRVLISVFASNPVRGGGGYVTFTLDGTLVENHCT